jgi:hypothetical protein
VICHASFWTFIEVITIPSLDVDDTHNYWSASSQHSRSGRRQGHGATEISGSTLQYFLIWETRTEDWFDLGLAGWDAQKGVGRTPCYESGVRNLSRD